MPEEKTPFNEIFNNLKQARDELKVQIHLGKAEAKDEWNNLEKKWEDLKAQSEKIAVAAEDTAKDVGSAMDLAADELKKGYERIKKLI